MKGGSVLNSRDDVINDDAKLCGKGADKSSTSPLAVNCRLEYAAGAGAIAVIIVALLALGVRYGAFVGFFWYFRSPLLRMLLIIVRLACFGISFVFKLSWLIVRLSRGS